MAEVSNILATSRSCGNIHCSYHYYQPGKITLQVWWLNILEVDPGFVLLWKWWSRISFLWNVKQGIERLRGVFMQSYNLCISPCGFWCAKFPVISPRSSCFEAFCLRVIPEVLEFSGLNSLLWSIQFEKICWSFSWKS